MTLKQRFFDAIMSGELGSVEDRGVIVTLKELKNHFKDIKTRYITSFLPAAVIEPGQHSVTHTKFLFRVCKGVYLVHPDAIETYEALQQHRLLIHKPMIKEPQLIYIA
jgi:hypothetical protein